LCRTCDVIDTNCTSCEGSNKNLTNNCKCNDGHYFPIGTIDYVCKTCKYNCLTCIEYEDKCTICKGNNRRTNIPLCTCKSGFFEQGVSDCAGKNIHYTYIYIFFFFFFFFYI
jgi:hypothetical protein